RIEMNWNSRRRRFGQHRVHRMALAIATTLLTVAAALPVLAEDFYLAPAFFEGKLTPESSWNQILTTRDIYAKWPELAFGSTFVPLSGVCLDGDMLAVADPHKGIDMRVSADEFREQAGIAMRGGPPAPVERYAAAGPGFVGSSTQPPNGAIRYPVDVYKVLP